MKESDKNEQKKELEQVSFAEFVAPDYEEWKTEAIAALKGGAFEKKLLTKTYEGITLEPMYTMEMAPSPDTISNLPGMEDYMRGTKYLGYMDQPWLISQKVDDPIPLNANKLIKNELKKGSTAINIMLDEATKDGKNGFAINNYEVKGGVSITTIEDAYEIFSEIDLSQYELYINAGGNNSLIIGLLEGMLVANSRKSSDLHGLIGANPLGELASKGRLPSSLNSMYDELAKVVKWSQRNTPELRTILIDGQVFSDGGASAVQELGYCLATGISYIRALQQRGLEVNVICKQIQFNFSLGAIFFMEISKIRAARKLWKQIVESFGGNEESQKMIIHATTANFNKSVYDPYVNMLRTTTEAFSGVVGGVDSMEVQPFDSAIRLGDDFSRRIARNTQIMLQNECNLLQPIDPAGGSWYIETLTKQVADKAWLVLQTVEESGGMEEALKAGSVQADIENVLEQRFKALEKRVDKVVGINMYANMLEELLEANQLNGHALAEERTIAIKEFISDIDEQYRDEKLAELKECLVNNSPMYMSVLSNAFAAGATLNDVAKIIYDEPFVIECNIAKHRLTEKFEELRNKAKLYKNNTGENLKVFLANMGKIPQHKARADFSTGFVEVGGFEVLKNDGFMTIEEAAKAAQESGALATIICSTDDTYPEIVPVLTKMIKENNENMIVLLAGAPAPEFEKIYLDAGIDEFIHVRANCYNILTWLQSKGGIK